MVVQRKRHYYVIAGSTIGHIALLFVFSQIALNRVAHEELPHDSRKSTPARVSVEDLPAVPGGFPAAEAAGLPPLSEPDSAFQQDSTPSTPLKMNQETLTAADRPEYAPQQTSAEQNEPLTETDSRELPATTYNRQGGEIAPPRKKKRKYSGAAFMNAFQHAVTSNREADSAVRGSGYAHSASQGNDVPTHVQERLAVWRDLHFREKIRYALDDQILRTKKVVYGPTKISISTRIVINKQGKLINTPEINTGSIDADEFIREIIEQASFPPVPLKFNRDEWSEPFNFDLAIPAGYNTSQLVRASANMHHPPPVSIY